MITERGSVPISDSVSIHEVVVDEVLTDKRTDKVIGRHTSVGWDVYCTICEDFPAVGQRESHARVTARLHAASHGEVVE